MAMFSEMVVMATTLGRPMAGDVTLETMVTTSSLVAVVMMVTVEQELGQGSRISQRALSAAGLGAGRG